MRINLNYKSLSRLSMDLNVMLRSNKGHTYILCIIDEVTNYLITVPIHQLKSEEIGDTLIEDKISKSCIPDYVNVTQSVMIEHHDIKTLHLCYITQNNDAGTRIY